MEVLRPLILTKTGQDTIPGVSLLRSFELFADKDDMATMATPGLRRLEATGTALAQTAGSSWRARPTGSECPICLETIEDGAYGIVTGCEEGHHAAHYACLSKLNCADGLYACPVCRGKGELHKLMLPSTDT